MYTPFLMESHEEKVASPSLRFSTHSGIAWLRDSAGIFVFCPPRQKYWLLAGLEADLWDWIVLGHPWDDMIKRFALMTDASEEAARQGIFRFIRYLVQEEIWVEAS